MKKTIFLILILFVNLNLFSQKIDIEGKSIPNEVLNVKLYTSENDSLTLNKLIEQFKGQLIYIDFWASWCSACIEEMPYSKALDQKFDDSQVVFLYFSTDTENEAWLKAIKNFENKNHNFRINKNDKILIQQYFEIKGIPHIIIIDKNSNVATRKAKYPSSSKAEQEIVEILNN